MFVFTILIGQLTAPDPVPLTGNAFQITYHRAFHSTFDDFPNAILDTVKHLISNTMNTVGLHSNHKSRRKRDLERENRLELLNDNQLDKDEKSVEEDDSQPKFVQGFEGFLQRLAQSNRPLKIVYSSNGKDFNSNNDIIRAMRRRRKRSVEDETLLREKRYAMEYKSLETEYSRCKKEAPNEKECEKIWEKLKKLSAEINKNFIEMTNLIHDFKDKRKPNLEDDLNDSFPRKIDKKKLDKFFDSDESEERKTKKKDKPESSASNTTTTPKITTETTSTTIKMTTTKHLKPKETTVNPLLHDKHGKVSEFEHNKIDDDAWSTKPIDHSTTPMTHTMAKSTTSASQILNRAANHTEHNTTAIPYDPDHHRPIVDECVNSIDDLLDNYVLGSGERKNHRNCTKPSTTETPKEHVTSTPETTVDDLHTHFGRPTHPIHEDLSGRSAETQDIHDFIMNRAKNRFHHNHDYVDRYPTTVESLDARTTKQIAPVAASGPFLNLCDQMRHQNHQQAPIKTTVSNHNNFQAQQFGGIGQTGFPVSGETSHVKFTSAYGGYVPNHFCFYQVPQPYGFARPMYGHHQPGGQSYSVPLHLLNDPNIASLIAPRTDQEGFINIPAQLQNLPGRRDAGEGSEPQNVQLICSIVGQGSVPRTVNTVTDHGMTDHSFTEHSVTESITHTTPVSITTVLGTSGQIPANDTEDLDFQQGRTAVRGHHCSRGWMHCANGHQCVRNQDWCNGKMDCLDGSDETHCPCVTRLNPKRVCDGYVDCPLGEDEMGCFGCDKFSFSCFNSASEYESAHKSGATCYSIIEKCDGFDNCFNRKDEQDCTMLVKDLGKIKAFSVGHTSGILHRNYKGKWYPVCNNPTAMARDACEAEVGALDQEPTITQMQGHLPGPFIQSSAKSVHVFQPQFTDGCKDSFNFVKCPPPKSGTSKLSEFPSVRIKIPSKQNATSESVGSVRIVGGSDAEPAAFPFIVAIFRDGRFHCGGSIFTEHWIITAAHCCDHHHTHYYELRAGMLRKDSFAPQVQIVVATNTIVHHGYSAEKMANDIALMRTNRPFHYNRWVRPISLPDRHRTSNDRDWVWGPKAGTLCTVIGWGAMWEHGKASDHLKYVTVPVLPTCKHKNDRDGLYICAGLSEGGQDACQGDSGGPFVCQSVSNPHESYLAGVVSHGEGCARQNEPGVYTRVALYLDWIRNKIRERSSDVTTSVACPGFHCPWGTAVCLPLEKRCDGVVDCLGGEDEANCPMDNLFGSFMNKTGNVKPSSTTTTVRPHSMHSKPSSSTTLKPPIRRENEIPPGAHNTSGLIVSPIESPSIIVQPTTVTAEYNFSSTVTFEPNHITTDSATHATTTQNEKTSTTSKKTDVSMTTVGSTSTTTETTSTTHSTSIPTHSTTEQIRENKTLPHLHLETPSNYRLQNESNEHQSNSTLSLVKIDSVGNSTHHDGNATIHSNSSAHHDDMEPGASDVILSHEPANEHPFFRQLVDLHDEKYKRLNRFHLSAHNLHTSLMNISQVQPLNDTHRYKRFACNRIRQTINIAHRCDRVIDCEDGSDEIGCTCRDYLQDKYDFLICDGKTDCWDLTDEKDCFKCDPGKYPCRMSRKCISEKQLCDDHPDCPLHEDELDCLALTDGHKIYFDANNLSLYKYDGLVTKNVNGTWKVVCGVETNNQSAMSVGKICSFLGFAGYQNYSHHLLDVNGNKSTTLSGPVAKLVTSHRNISSEPKCMALHITCVPYINATEHEISHFENQHKEIPVQVNIRPINPIEKPHLLGHITFHENAHIEFIENFGDDYDWPWNVDIYLEGEYLCSAIIVDVHWIIVESSYMRLINLKHDHLSIVAGGAKAYLKITGPYEQVVRVDCYHFIPDARVVMLHLEKKLSFTRHVLPTFIPEKESNITDNQCLAVAQDKLGRTRTLRVHLNMTNCPEKNICYQRDPEHDHYHAEHCYTEAAIRSGVVVCKTKFSGWYPVGFYQHKRGLCGFNEVVRMISLKEYYNDIQHVLGHHKCDYDFPSPPCAGKRCRYGKCVDHSLVCDWKLDCNDGSDEREDWCAAKNETSSTCSPTHFRCQNGRCVDKSKFCDGRNDCGDLSDEPHECSCYTYIKVTEPAKICDGIRNCWDKSDENPRLCKCREDSFRCGDSSICIPHDFVCDGDVDCPEQEDERFCYALQQNHEETNYGEVMQQTFGVWHSKCFPKNVKYDDLAIKEICRSIGYRKIPKVYGRKMLQESRLRTANNTGNPVDRLRKTATKAVVLNKFSKVVINDKQSFFMKPSRPMFRLVNWDEEDERACDRLEINCGN
ncbi:serine protease nudel [Topomyia yanbarensis]|uniref:serine protease nudel n=1 Tax=Topomyia yanbarensis TaxID=2498891 RepID=UPI00273B9834|nr:serine protease nudel [Topomyia yanbarensis]